MDFSDGISAILRGNAIIFYGAGFSIDNKNILNENVPLTNKLSYDLQKLSGIDDSEIDMNVSIQNTSEYFIEVNGESKLVELLKQKFTVSDSTEWQKIIARQNWKRVYTTNYDNVFETASNEVKKHRVPININDRISNNKDNTTDIVHLNGYVDDITEGNLANSTKLTSESYTDTYFIEGPWRNEFEIDLEHSQAIFFVGFSLDYDLDLK
ncbi:SIR2 family protein, partial [Enterococcus entomosocium]